MRVTAVVAILVLLALPALPGRVCANRSADCPFCASGHVLQPSTGGPANGFSGKASGRSDAKNAHSCCRGGTGAAGDAVGAAASMSAMLAEPAGAVDFGHGEPGQYPALAAGDCRCKMVPANTLPLPARGTDLPAYTIATAEHPLESVTLCAGCLRAPAPLLYDPPGIHAGIATTVLRI